MNNTYKQILAKQHPAESGWYNTDKGELFWFAKEQAWSCRNDCISEEWPNVWYKEYTYELPDYILRGEDAEKFLHNLRNIKPVSKEELERIKKSHDAIMAITKTASSEINWAELRNEFFRECTRDFPNNFTSHPDKKISFTPHNMFEWFRNKIESQTTRRREIKFPTIVEEVNKILSQPKDKKGAYHDAIMWYKSRIKQLNASK